MDEAKWEYKVIMPPTRRFEMEKEISSLGNEGWELVIVTSTGLFIFKRQQIPGREPAPPSPPTARIL